MPPSTDVEIDLRERLTMVSILETRVLRVKAIKKWAHGSAASAINSYIKTYSAEQEYLCSRRRNSSMRTISEKARIT
ncbi:protein of unknown function [Burkholderia multivorans]